MRIAAIVNPVAGRRKVPVKWPELLCALGSDAAGIKTFRTEYAGHAELLAAEARRSGYDRVIAVGGDGTLHEVLNGLWWEGRGVLPSVGMVPLGTGCDYIRNFEVGGGLIERLRAAVGLATVELSLGRCRTQNVEGERERVFAMILGLGFDAEVIRRFRTGQYGCTGWTAYVVSALKASGSLNSYALGGNINGSSFHANAIFFGTALGCCFGKRIIIAPSASPVQNQFELVRIEPAGFFNLLLSLFFAYLGAHYRLPWVKTAQANRIFLDSSPPAWIEADGELIGKTPVEIEIIPHAFSFAARAVRKTCA